MRLKRFLWELYLFLCLLIFTSCTKSVTQTSKIDLHNSFYYLKGGADSSINQIQNRSDEFDNKLTFWGRHNLAKITGSKDSYIWLKADFFIPDDLRGKDLGILIDYIHFAEKIWVNGTYIGESGVMPNEKKLSERSSMYAVHYYTIPEAALNQKEINSVYIKVYAKGNAEISGKAFIAEKNVISQEASNSTFVHSRIYLVFVAGPFAAFVLFFVFFISRKKNKNQLYYLFAMQNFFTVILFAYLASSEIPLYVSFGIPHITFVKITLCISIYFIVHFLSLFEIQYVAGSIQKSVMVVKYFLLFITVLPTILVRDLQTLMSFTPFMIVSCVIQWGLGIFYTIKGLFIKEQKKNAIILNIAFLPLYISIIIDLIIRIGFSYTELPYLTIFGHQIANLFFIVTLAGQMNKAVEKNEYLNKNLEREIEIQTVDIKFANERLEQEVNRSKQDLEMASLVQKKFLPPLEAEYKGWDVSILYEPLAKVSGDLYDYYNEEDKLHGFSLFDASGHGVAASLVTMLSKNIIFKSFRNALRTGCNVSSALIDINDTIISAKGNVENYLTGILVKFGEIEMDGTNSVQLASAGHPYPIWYSTEKNDIEELLPDVNHVQFGAIGIPEIDVSFPDIEFTMKKGDVLVCYTDGLLESSNEDRVEFGWNRVADIVKEFHDLSAKEINNKLIGKLNKFLGESLRDDDITIIVLKRL